MIDSLLLRRSAWLVGALTIGAAGGLVALQSLAGRSTTVSSQLATRQAEVRRTTLSQSIRSADRTAIAATVPTEPALAIVYPAFESLAARHSVTLRYDFSTALEGDPALALAETAKDSWVIPIDFLGPRPALETILTELETGPYLTKLHGYRFDVTDPAESVLSTTLILYGK